MKKIFAYSMTAAILLLTGCSDPAATAAAQAEKDSKPAFMFWCFRKEIQEEQFYVPQLTTEAAAQYLSSYLRTLPELTDVSFDLAKQSVSIKYKSSAIRKMNLEEAIARAGFAVNGRPANPEAKLPQGVE